MHDGAEAGDTPFVHAGADWPMSTQARIRVRPTTLVAKEQVASLPAFVEHPIVRAPMGTVFPVDEAAWSQLRPLLSEPPAAADAPVVELPPAFAWRQRAKGVLPMPGGYGGYLISLRALCELVDQERPAQSELSVRMEGLLGVASTAARQRESFLRKMGVVQIEAGVARLSDWTRRWVDTGDDRIMAALLHSRCQLIGELLELCREPRSIDELLAAANARFAMGWDTNTQINNRRGWLQSAGMLEALDDRRVQLTDGGAALLSLLEVHPPGDIVSPPFTGAPATIAVSTDEKVAIERRGPLETHRAAVSIELGNLLVELGESSTDSSDPDRFERAVTDAFTFLGFRSEWLGKSGRTDVLVDALLGKTDSYRAIIDCKTSGSGSVNDHQVDWVTLSEHRTKHDADHVMVVAPNPSGSRLFDRARQHEVAVMSADQLIGVCRQHARSPLSLDDYRELFLTGGAVDTGGIDERAAELDQLGSLAAAICDTIRTRSETFDRLSARDLFLILADDPVADGATEERIQLLLDALSNPLIGAVQGTAQLGYRMTSSTASSRRRLELLGGRIDTDTHGATS